MAVLTRLQVGGVQPQVRPLSDKLTLEEALDPLIELAAEPGDLTLTRCRLSPAPTFCSASISISRCNAYCPSSLNKSASAYCSTSSNNAMLSSATVSASPRCVVVVIHSIPETAVACSPFRQKLHHSGGLYQKGLPRIYPEPKCKSFSATGASDTKISKICSGKIFRAFQL